MTSSLNIYWCIGIACNIIKKFASKYDENVLVFDRKCVRKDNRFFVYLQKFLNSWYIEGINFKNF